MFAGYSSGPLPSSPIPAVVADLHTGSCPYSKIASLPAKRSCIQLAGKVRTPYSVRNAPRPTTIEHSIWNALLTLPTPRPSISGLSLAIRAPLCSLARMLNAFVAFRYTAPAFASLAQHALDPRFFARDSICAIARDVWRVRVVLALLYTLSSRWDSSCSRNERMESEASWNGAQSMTSWGGWTTDDQNGAVARATRFDSNQEPWFGYACRYLPVLITLIHHIAHPSTPPPPPAQRAAFRPARCLPPITPPPLRFPPPLPPRASEGLITDIQGTPYGGRQTVVVPSKRLHNKISSFTTHLMKLIQKGPRPRHSFKLQVKERERKDNYVPEVSALNTSASGGLEIDPDTKALLIAINFDPIPISVVDPITTQPECSGPGGGSRREMRNILGATR
ncbi:ribosomal S17-domain-containing protein [Mycena olivaceomarginata]|nr:ribosomal S17-domain-containing protein [Mycena olivaceomarginata]